MTEFQDYVSYYNQENDHLKMGEFEEAIADFNQAISLDPNSVEAYSGRGYAYCMLAQPDRLYFDKALLNPEDDQTYNKLKIYYLEKALADYSKVISLCAEDDNQFTPRLLGLNKSYAYYMRGHIYEDLEAYKKAIDDYNQLILLTPNSANAYYERGCCYGHRDVRDYQQSLLDFTQAISLDPNCWGAYSARGTLYYLLGEYQKALVDLNQSLSLDKDGIRTRIRTLLIIGMIEYEQNNQALASDAWQQAYVLVEGNPLETENLAEENPEIYLAIAVTFYRQGNVKKAVSLANKALSIDSELAKEETLSASLWGSKLLADTIELLKTMDIGPVEKPLKNYKKKKPNSRHFYLFKNKKDGNFKSGLSLDGVQLDNTVIVPVESSVIDEDVELINKGLAKYKKLVFLRTQHMHKLTLPWATSLCLYLFLLFVPLTKFNVIDALFRSLLGLPFYWLFFFIIIIIIKFVCFFIGVQRINVFKFTLNFFLVWNVSLAVGSILMSPSILKGNLGQLFAAIIFLCISVLVAWLQGIVAVFVMQVHQRYLKIEQEWIVNHKVYGEHLNQNDIPVLFPKRGKGFYHLGPREYRKLMAYQQANGDTQESQRLLNMWQSQPLLDPQKDRLYTLEKLNPVVLIGTFIYRLTFSLLASLCHICASFLKNIIGNSALYSVENWLRVRGINRVYWIYKICDAAAIDLLKNIL